MTPDEPNETASAEQPAVKVTKSIVPKKYAGRYKNPNDALSQFIKDQCTNNGSFDFGLFFGLCRANGIEGKQVDKYEELVKSKAHGAEGRARMTLRNMLATIVRKNGKLKNIDNEDVELSIPKAVVSGAAKAASEKASAEAA